MVTAGFPRPALRHAWCQVSRRTVMPAAKMGRGDLQLRNASLMPWIADTVSHDARVGYGESDDAAQTAGMPFSKHTKLCPQSVHRVPF